MKKLLLMILVLALLAININCGSSSSGSNGSSIVSITVDEGGQSASVKIEKNTLFAQAKLFVRNLIKSDFAVAAIPSNVNNILFTISAPDMTTIPKDVPVAGQCSITETFLVPNGNNRHFLVEAKDSSGTVLYRGSTTADLDGTPITLSINMVALDITPPTVISTSPANNATGVSITSAITITFSETIDSSTFNSTTFTLRNGGNNVAGTVTSNGATVTFTLSSNLVYSTTYTATITTGVKDLAGIAMAANYTWRFATTPDEVSPPEDIALNLTGSGFPHPLESDRGWGGGSYPWEIIDSKRLCSKEGASGWACGLAFTGGSASWDGETCGWRQATINLGEPKAFNRVVVWHHGLEHVPNTYKIQYWDGTNWVDVFSTTNGHSYLKFPTDFPQYWWESWSTPTENTFPLVTSGKVRFALYNCDITHGWIYEFEVYKD